MTGSNLQLDGIARAALEIAAKRQELLTQLRAALVRHDDKQALQLARQLCGLRNDKN